MKPLLCIHSPGNESLLQRMAMACIMIVLLLPAQQSIMIVVVPFDEMLRWNFWSINSTSMENGFPIWK